MGCNCGKGTPKGGYVYTAPNGATQTYSTQVEAQAAKIRNGGGTVRAA